MGSFKCPNCSKDISNSFLTEDSEVSGFLNYSFECEDCKITIYTLKIEKGISE